MPSHLPTASGSGFLPELSAQLHPWVGARRVPGQLSVLRPPLSFVLQRPVSLASLEYSAAEKPACWPAGLQPPRCLSHSHFSLFCHLWALESQAGGGRLGRQQAAGTQHQRKPL